MIKSVNIDGEGYVIRSCASCPFHDFHNSACKHPKVEDYVRYTAETFPENCPLGLVKDCCTCKYEEHRKEDEYCEPCINCMITWHGDTDVEDPPSKWEVKE